MKKQLIITADIETFLIKENNSNEYYHVPIMLSLYFNHEIVNFSINRVHYNGSNLKQLSDDMLSSFLNFLDKFSLENSVLLYFHNMSTFDGFLLLNYIIRAQSKEIFDELLIRSSRIYKLKYKAVTILDS